MTPHPQAYYFNSHVEVTTNVMVLNYLSEHQCFEYLYTPSYPTGSLAYLSWIDFLSILLNHMTPPLIFVQEKDSSPPSWLILNSLAPLYINNDQSLIAELKQTVKIPKSTIIQIKSVFHKNPIKKKRKINAILPFYWHQVLRCEKKYSPHPGKKQFRHVKNAHLTFPPCST